MSLNDTVRYRKKSRRPYQSPAGLCSFWTLLRCVSLIGTIIFSITRIQNPRSHIWMRRTYLSFSSFLPSFILFPEILQAVQTVKLLVVAQRLGIFENLQTYVAVQVTLQDQNQFQHCNGSHSRIQDLVVWVKIHSPRLRALLRIRIQNKLSRFLSFSQTYT